MATDFFELIKRETGKVLNPVQSEAVLYTESPLLLLASPGSGKTTTLNIKIADLILKKGLNPNEILALTFSQASARDMEERFQSFFHNIIPEKVKFSTIHSFTFSIVRDYFNKYGKKFELIEGDIEKGINGEVVKLNKKAILKKIYYNINKESISEDEMDELLRVMGYVKNKLIPVNRFREVSTELKNFSEIYQEYEAFKKQDSSNILIDFDDMLVYANAILKKDKAICHKYQSKYRYILTDESQDTSLVQHEIIEKLAQPHNNICVVADDDQTLYSWRGADVNKILNFKQTYPNAKILFMEQNYRSSKDIVDVSNQFIKRNKKRYKKNMFTENPSKQPIRILNVDTYEAQIHHIINQLEGEENLQEVAILYRNNSSSISIINGLDLAGIPFYMKDSDNKFFSHWILKDILNFFELAQDDKNVEVLERIHTKFNAYISKKQIQLLKTCDLSKSVFSNLIEEDSNLFDWQKKNLRNIKGLFAKIRKSSPAGAITLIRNDLGYDKMLAKISERLGISLEGLLSTLNTLETLSKSITSIKDFGSRIEYLEGLLKSSKFNKSKNVVTLSTFHSSKGLEFEKVFMVDLVNGVIPTKENIKDYKEGKIDDMEEMARLFYVGMTRAKTDLTLLSYKTKGNEPFVESIFVKNVKQIMNPELVKNKSFVKKNEKLKPKPKQLQTQNKSTELLKVIVGSVVSHKKFGTGKITEIKDDILHIEFENGIEKVLSLRVCSENQILQLESV